MVMGYESGLKCVINNNTKIKLITMQLHTAQLKIFMQNIDYKTFQSAVLERFA